MNSTKHSIACHLLRLDDLILTADYGRGSVSVFPIGNEVVQPKTCSIFFDGSGPDPERQSHSHIHQLKLLPKEICSRLGIEGDWILASDLGGDCIYLLTVDDKGQVIEHPQLTIRLEAGTGARHMELNARKEMLYCLSEIGGKVFALRIGGRDGAPYFTQVQAIKADLADAAGSADIHIHPSTSTSSTPML